MDTPYANGATYYPDHRRQQFPTLPNLQSQFSQTSQGGSHTLPPLQPQRPALALANDLFGQSGRSQQPVVPAQSSQINDYTSQGRPRYPISSAQYPPSLSQFSNNTSYISQASHTIPYNHNPTTAVTQGQLHDLRPMPSGGIVQNSTLSADYDPSQSFNLLGATQDQEDPPRTHVVGSQGRRGILPSAAGRPAAVTREGTTTKSSIVPIKDADGKFPCPHCNKTYLHAKHLKRHLLRRKYNVIGKSHLANLA